MDTRDLRRERLADLTREAEEELPKADERWTRLPGGMIIERKDSYDLYRPVSLPHTRRLTQATFSGMFWISVGCIMIAAAIALVWWLA